MRWILAAVASALLLAPASSPASLAGDLRRALRPAGSGAGLVVHDLSRGRRVVAVRAGIVRPLASNAKLFTMAAALRVLGADGRLATSAFAAPDPGGTVPGDLYIRGEGDPVLGRASLDRLADRVAARVRVVHGGVVGDETLFDSWRGRTGAAFEPELGGVLGALVYDRGRAVDSGPFQADPGRAAAARFDDALEARGVVIHGVPRTGQVPAGMAPLATVTSPLVRRILPAVGKRSDNFVAEMLTKVLGARARPPGTTAGGAAEIAREAKRLGAAATLVDGSGLAVEDRAAPREVVDLLRAMRADSGFTRSLAIAGVDGTVSDRMRRGPARGRCRLKTGTLREARVSTLAGYCRGRRSQRTYAFSVQISRRGERSAERVQDRIAHRLARG